MRWLCWLAVVHWWHCTDCDRVEPVFCCSDITGLHWHWSGQGHEGGKLIGINDCWVLKLYHCPHHQSGCHPVKFMYSQISAAAWCALVDRLRLVTFLPQPRHRSPVTAPRCPPAQCAGVRHAGHAPRHHSAPARLRGLR